ncbi:hypothetical protein [Paraburkholderia sp. BL25I1N1]|uniref:hypothetical protein n=1 Tax=Paraburkholderia sp. BL25I1N1 TaxID=1938804 RepID=UPI0015E5F5E9|nr:hypothetical protein [Paraburkholderia sp. BL25I1N1]
MAHASADSALSLSAEGFRRAARPENALEKLLYRRDVHVQSHLDHNCFYLREEIAVPLEYDVSTNNAALNKELVLGGAGIGALPLTR